MLKPEDFAELVAGAIKMAVTPLRAEHTQLRARVDQLEATNALLRARVELLERPAAPASFALPS